jgi:hypothetical protein
MYVDEQEQDDLAGHSHTAYISKSGVHALTPGPFFNNHNPRKKVRKFWEGAA